jgi:hypothetical protein
VRGFEGQIRSNLQPTCSHHRGADHHPDEAQPTLPIAPGDEPAAAPVHKTAPAALMSGLPARHPCPALQLDRCNGAALAPWPAHARV